MNESTGFKTALTMNFLFSDRAMYDAIGGLRR
jgi:hypothetical protein